MFQRLHIPTIFFAGVLLWAGPGQAAPKKSNAGSKEETAACVYAYKNGVAHEQAGKLRAALESLRQCSRAVCGAAMFKECSRRATKLDDDIPSVVPVVTDAGGRTLTDVRVAMDGEELLSKISGHAVRVEPGEHEFTFRADKGVLGIQKVLILQGQRNRPLALHVGGAAPAAAAPAAVAVPAAAVEEATGEAPAAEAPLAEAPPDEPRAQRSGRSWLGPALLGGGGVLGIAGYGMLTYWGNRDNRLLEECRPDCKPQSLKHIDRLFLAGKIALGAGLAALAGATYLYLSSGPSSSTEVALHHSRYRFDLGPAPAGAWAAVSGSF